jgi:hypothetical protein
VKQNKKGMARIGKISEALTTNWLLFLAVFLVPGIQMGWCQVEQSEPFEIEQKNSDEYFTVISLKDEGLALIREKERYNQNKKLWEIIILDTDLIQKKKFDLEINPRHQMLGYEIDKNKLFLLFRTGETTKNSMELIEINTSEGLETGRFEIKPELDFKVTHFTKAGSRIVLGGYVSNEPAVLLYEIDDHSIKVIPGFFQKDNELVDLRVNQNQTFNSVLIDRSLRMERKLVFNTFDETGKLLLDDVVPIDEDKSLQNSISSTLEREELVLLGTWGDKQGKQSLGFFSLTVDPFNEQKINYFHFGMMDHFLDYLNPKRAERIKESTHDAIMDKRKPSFTAYVMPFEITETADGFLLLAEVYNTPPMINPYYNNPYGNPYYSNPYYYNNPFWPSYYPGMRMYRPYDDGTRSRESENIKYFQTVIVAFNGKGDLIWDHSIVLDDMKRLTLEQMSDFYTDDKKLHVLYKKESELKVKSIALADGTAEEMTQKIKLKDPIEEIRSEKDHEDGLRHWIGNTFYLWGYHTVRNSANKENRVRDVFYINKIVVH